LRDVETTAELARIMRLVFKRKLPWFVLGSGSNLLVGDGGIRGHRRAAGRRVRRDRAFDDEQSS
jgi:UDP-N-acetylenolpyruvoylglucosamine reductase